MPAFGSPSFTDIPLRRIADGHIYIAAAGTTDAAYADYVCNGATDGTVINSAIAALPTQKGARLILSPGIFTIDTPILINHDGVVLQGAGKGDKQSTAYAVGTMLQPTVAVTGQVILVQHPLNARPLASVGLRDFSIDGRALPALTDGIVFRSFKGNCFNIGVWQCTGNGIRVQGYPTWVTYDSQFTDCQFDTNTLDGIYLDAYCTDTHWLSCLSTYNLRDGMSLNPNSGGTIITAPHFYDNQQNGIHFASGGSYANVTGGKVENSRQHGIHFDNATAGVSYVKIVGTNLRKNGRGGSTNQYNQIQFTHTTGNGQNNNQIVGCTFMADTMDNTADKYKPGYHINIAGTTINDTRISNNGFVTADVQTGVFQDFGTRSSFNGAAKQASDPTLTGAWLGKGEEGITVRNTVNNALYLYQGGVWIIQNAKQLGSQTVGTTQATIPHGLGVIPTGVYITMSSAGTIWESASADATNVYLIADAAARTAHIQVRS